MKNKILILPMQPTPNGRMHIGHGSGTYLRADILGRALKVRGHNVSIITGSDAFENWVLADAKQSGRTPDETCTYYHEAIFEDLNKLDINFDVWIDPRKPDHYEGYLKTHENVLKWLQETNHAYHEEENVPYSLETGEALMGTWIAGECPYCGGASGGSSCTFCGAHFQPEELINPKSRLDNSPLEWRKVKSWFARPEDPKQIINNLTDAGIREVWMEAVNKYIEHQGGRIRLSEPGNWGMKSNMVSKEFILKNPYYLYSVYCGEVYMNREKDAIHPLHPDSEVTTIGVFGNDNSTPGLIAPHSIAQGSGGKLKPFDYTIVNGMLLLEGKKCSTSKRHGIWLSELLEGETEISSDELRYFVSHAPLDEGSANISLDDLVSNINSFRNWVSQKLVPVVQEVQNATTVIQYNEKLANLLKKQNSDLNPNRMDLPTAVASLEGWMYDTTTEKGEWLLGIALLGAPIIPELAKNIWNQIGLSGEPSIDKIENKEIHVHENTFECRVKPLLSVESLLPYVHLAGVHA